MASLNFKSGSNNSKLTIIVILVSVIVLLNAVILVIYLKKDKDPDPLVGTQSRDTSGPEASVALDTLTPQNSQPGQRTPDQPERTYVPPEQSSRIPGIYPQASLREITYREIKGMHVWDVIVMRNEIYARYGYIFTKSWELRDYFNAQSWYRPLSSYVENQLTEIEKRNVQFLLNHTPQFDMNNIRGSNTYVR